MFGISATPLPASSFLTSQAETAGHYTDCFDATVDGPVSITDFIEAFFNSPVLRLERKLIGLAVQKSSPADVTDFASGKTNSLAVWTTETRGDDQITMLVKGGRIRSWLMVEPAGDQTRLLFGSSVTPVTGKDGSPTLGFGVRAFMGFHILYAKICLASARYQVNKSL